MKKKRSQLLRDLIAPNPDIESIFFRLKVILNDLPDIDKTVQIKKWIDNELSGYPNSTLLPEYRIMKGTPQGTYILDSRRHLTRNKCKTRQIKVWTVF